MRRRSGAPVRLLPLLALLASPSVVTQTAPEGAVLLGPDNVVYRTPEGPQASGMTPLAVLGGAPIRDMVRLGEMRLLVMPAEARESGRRGARTGRVEVVSIGGTSPVPVPEGRIEFQGEGVRLAGGGDGVAWVLARGGGRGEAADGPYRVHRLDLRAGRVTASIVLPGPAESIAVAPLDGRLFVGLEDRIVTLSAGSRPALSWFYRSPGRHPGLAFRPRTDHLYAARGRGVAVFDPDIIAARGEVERHALEDDATAVIPVPFEVEGVSFPAAGDRAAVYGVGPGLALIDAAAAAGAEGWDFEPPAGTERVRPVAFSGAGTLVLALFPGAAIVDVPLPEPAPPPLPAPGSGPPRAAAPGVAPSAAGLSEAAPPVAGPSEAAPSEAGLSEAAPPESAPPGPGVGVPEPPAKPDPVAPAAPAAVTPPRGTSAAVLRGRIEGDRSGVRAVVVYGPDSIVREQARVAPAADGSWETPLPPPGTYRVVLATAGTESARVVPNFRTLRVAGAGLEGIDFTVEFPAR